MIRYYAYYSFGGYKDFYLGSNEDAVASRYYLSLLPTYENDKNDKSMADKVAEWKELPPIINLSTDTSAYNYPTEARVMMSHAGYKLQYRHFDGKGVFAIRDVRGHKDLYGRDCPFVMMMVADTDEDKKHLEIVSYYVWKNLNAAETLFCSLFVYDKKVNGLRFDVSILNKKLREIVSSKDGSLEENTYNRPVHFFVWPDEMCCSSAFKEQNCDEKQVAIACNRGVTKGQDFYRYVPNDTQQPQEKPRIIDESPSQSHSFRNFAKVGDLATLIKSFQQLQNRVEKQEHRIHELEHRIHELENNKN